MAIRLVEKAMTLGVPDAYDRMGIYHQNGLLKGGSATSAYAFFQRAADMGSPSGMTFLGDRMGASYDDPDEKFLANVAIATKILECALAQGYGPAAYALGFLHQFSKNANANANAKAEALKVLQEGVRLGCAECANRPSVEVSGIYIDDEFGLVKYVDEDRSVRYRKIKYLIDHYRGRLRLPNLDKVLPRPPAPLPNWDGNVKTLIDAARSTTLEYPPVPNSRGVHLPGKSADEESADPVVESTVSSDDTIAVCRTDPRRN
ncbi:sel1 repeat family protein [Paraburkholderia sp. Se-20369]|nr:sel1 repeat family protein [Paraburkholderia sp. Se-20369]